MQLTEVHSLTAEYQSNDINEIVAVMQSGFPTTPSLMVRWSKVNPTDAQGWLRQASIRGFKQEFQLPRITSLKREDEFPTARYAEHLVIRDQDLDHLEEKANSSVPPGRIVAHADFRYYPSYGSLPEEQSGDVTATAFAPGYNQELHSLINSSVETGLHNNFHGLPCFELHGISTLSPSHLRKGIAKMLVEWIFPFSERFALPVILAASPLGLPLYRKCGFTEYRKQDIIVDLARWGCEDIHRHVIMVRWPENLDRLPGVWKEWKEAEITR